MKDKIRASVILPTYNRLPVLKNCLKAFSNQTTKNFEIILIDDCSSDGTKRYIESGCFKNLEYIRLEKHSGPYYARNLGIKKAHGDIIIFVDSDVVVFPDFVADHIKIHEKNEDVVVQGMVRHVKTVKEVNLNSFYIPNALCLRTFITQNASVRRKYLISVGGFESFGSEMGYKDIDVGFKLRDLGLYWKYGIRTCKAFHVDGIVTQKDIMKTFEKWSQQGESAYYFVKKWGKRGERYARTKRAILYSRLLRTDDWIERESVGKMIAQSRKNFGLIAALLKGIARYHYRKKGIEGAFEDGSFCSSSGI